MRTAGPDSLSLRMPTLVGLGAIVLLVFGLGGWAVNARIDGAVIAPGEVIVEQNRQAVQHLDGGTVAEVLVKEGDTVAADTLLMRLDPTRAQSELAVVENQLYEVMARRGRMEAERDEAERIVFDPDLVTLGASDARVQELMAGQVSLFEARQDTFARTALQLRNQQAQLDDQIVGIDAQMDASARQIQLIGTETETQQGLLDRGLAQSSRVLTLQREDARLSGLQGELMARRAQAMERMTEIDMEVLRLQTQRREEAIAQLRDLQINELEGRERRQTLLNQLAQMQIRAPVGGIVYDLKVFGPQAVVRAADPLLYIVPQDRPLVIAAQVDPVNVDKISAGLDVVLRFPAFNLRDTPDLIGKVTRISPDAFAETGTGRSYYRVEIGLPQAELDKLAADQILIPGMPVDCFIKTGDHTPFAYLTEPLVHYLSRAMRESS